MEQKRIVPEVIKTLFLLLREKTVASKITSVGGVHSLPTIFVGKNDGNRTLGEITGGGNAKGRGDAWNWKKGREKKKLVEIRSERERGDRDDR